MKKLFSRRPLTVDPAHMITLHQEAIEQLELMSTVVEASEHASDGMRDTLTRMAENHWEAYLDVLHMIWSQCRKITLRQSNYISSLDYIHH